MTTRYHLAAVADSAAHHAPPPSPQASSSDEHAIDRALVLRLQSAQGVAGGVSGPESKDAWTALVVRHQRRVFATCMRYCNNPQTAADLTQDTFVKVIQSIGTFDHRAQFATWLTRITINVCLSHRRSARVRKTEPLPGDSSRSLSGKDLRTRGREGEGSENLRAAGTGEARDGELSPLEGVELEERRRHLFAALAEIDPEQRALLILRDVQGLEYEQIAEVLGVPLGTLKSRLFRARLALRERVEAMRSNGSEGSA